MQNKEVILDFQSNLAPHLQGFLEEKRLLGFKYTRAGYELQSFDRFLRSYELVDELPKEIVLKWVERKPHQKPATVVCKISIVSEFAKYMNRHNLPAYVVPSFIAPKITHEHTPYVFNKPELKRFFEQADNLKYHKPSPGRHLVIPAMFRLLYCCGLRISEAILLKTEDVNLSTGIIHLKHTKEFLDRLIPLNDELLSYFINYRRKLEKVKNSSEYFFPSNDGGHYHIFTIRDNFKKLVWRSGIPYCGLNHGPRLHDLRHTFAVHSFERAISEGKDPMEILPTLSVYMGHKTYKGTERYLHLAAEVCPQIAQVFEERYGHLFPVLGSVK